MSITSRLLAELPEALWAEANRRLRLVPELSALAEEAVVLAAWCALRAESLWRPGSLALAAYAAHHPECQGSAEAWLLTEGRDKITSAYLKLTMPANNESLAPVDEALPAALALRTRLNATQDYAGLAHEAAAQRDRWRLPLQYLWGLLGEEAEKLLAALLRANEPGAELAGQCLVVNESVTSALVVAPRLAAPPGHWLAFARSLVSMGQAAYARVVLNSIPLPDTCTSSTTQPQALLALIEQAQLLAATGDFAAARPKLAEASEAARQLRALIAEQMGALAEQAGDAVFALAGYQEALTERPEAPELVAGLARALIKLQRPAEALTALSLDSHETPAPELILAAAQAQSALAQPDAALSLVRQLDRTSIPAYSFLADTARLFHSLSDHPAAIEWMVSAAERVGTEAALYLTAAQWLLNAGRAMEARPLAMEAAALQPASAETRETLGQSLLLCGEPAAAIAHFQSAMVFEPTRLSAALGLARAALAAGQPTLAHDTAQRVLSSTTDSLTLGQAHTLIGQALSAQAHDEAAFEHFRQASALVPSAPEPWRALAKHYRHHEDWEQALAALEAGRQALTLIASPDIAALLVDLAEAYTAIGRFTEAIQVLREACATLPPPGARRQLGILLHQQGQLAEAIQTLHQTVAENPSDWLARYALGQALEQNQQHQEAWAAYQQTVLARPDSAEPYFDLGRLTLLLCAAHHPSASPQQAVAALRQCIERAPDNAEAQALLAEAHYLAHQPEEALECYEHALRLAPHRTDWSLGFGEVCLALDFPEMAIAALAEAATYAPDDARVAFALARAYAHNKLWPEATRAAEAAIRFDPNNAALLALLAESYAQQHQPERAAQAWQAAVQTAPRDARLQVRYARSLLDMGHAAGARAVYAQALSLGPDLADVQLAAGRALLELGEAEQAYHVLCRAAELAPRSIEALATLGQAAMQAQKYEAAHAACLRAAELDPQRSQHLHEAGEALWALGRTAAAVVVWQNALRVNPTDAQLSMRLGLAYLSLNQPADALSVLEQALTYTADEIALVVLLRETARAALGVSEPAKALQYLEQAVRLSPSDAEVRYLLGRTYASQGQLAQARQAYQQAARLAPGEGRYVAACAEAAEDVAEALRLSEQALSISPDDPDVLELAGEIYLRADLAAPAVQQFTQLVSARPRDPSAYLALARALVAEAETRHYEISAGLIQKSDLPVTAGLAGLMEALQRAAALGAEAMAVRFNLARAKALLADPPDAIQLIEALLPSIEFSASMVDLLRSFALALRRAGQWARARETLQSAVQQADPAAKAHLDLGLTLIEMNDPTGAVAAFKRAVAGAPGWAIAAYHLAEALWQTQARVEATQALSRALTLRPEAAAWHYRLAQMHTALNEGDAALAHYQRAAYLNPRQAAYAAALARALTRDGDLTTAAAFFQRATEANPEDAVLWTERGQVYLARHDWRAAAASFARAILLAPTQVSALLGSARAALALGDLPDAANKAEAAARLAPDNPEALMCLADVSIARGETAKAEATLRAALPLTPRPTVILLALGRLYFTTRQYTQTIAVLEKAITGDAESEAALALLGEAHYATGNLDGALKAFREAHSLKPRHAKHLWWLGRICREQGQLDQALSHLLAARDLAPEDEEVAREAGLVFEARKQYDRALEMYHLAMRLSPATAINYTRAGVVLKQLKDYASALAALERAVALDPKSLEATKQLAVVSALNLMHGEQRVRA